MNEVSSGNWDESAEPLIKGPGPQSIDIFTGNCSKCGARVQFIGGQPAAHSCVVVKSEGN